MEFKDYYATLGLSQAATQADIKRAYRKLARKYHPDVSKEANAEDRFKEVSEAHEALIDPERRAAYDDLGQRRARAAAGGAGGPGPGFEPPPGWANGYEFSGRDGDARSAPSRAEFSEFFESMFGKGRAGDNRAGAGRPGEAPTGYRAQAHALDHHAVLSINVEDSFHGAQRSLSLRLPVVDAQGHWSMKDRQLEVQIPAGVRAGQTLRLAGQGAPGPEGGAAGDLYLEITFKPHAIYRIEGRDLYIDLPLAPWEAALGAVLAVATPQGEVALSVPAASVQGRKLRLKGRGLSAGSPASAAGDLYAVLSVVLPPADTDQTKAAYAALAQACAPFNPRSSPARKEDHGSH
jgi:curved DNA-binding protein